MARQTERTVSIANRKDKTMIEIKAEPQDDGRTKLSVKMNGTGDELVSETLIIIQTLLRELKKNDVLLHLKAIMAISKHPEILLSEDINLDKASQMKAIADKMSKGILKGGRN